MGLMQTCWVAMIRSNEPQLLLYQRSTDAVRMRGVQVDAAGKRESRAPFPRSDPPTCSLLGSETILKHIHASTAADVALCFIASVSWVANDFARTAGLCPLLPIHAVAVQGCIPVRSAPTQPQLLPTDHPQSIIIMANDIPQSGTAVDVDELPRPVTLTPRQMLEEREDVNILAPLVRCSKREFCVQLSWMSKAHA